MHGRKVSQKWVTLGAGARVSVAYGTASIKVNNYMSELKEGGYPKNRT